jgi:uncharacterized protein
MAKKGKVSSDDKKAIKTTVVIVAFFAIVAGIFLFLTKDKVQPKPTVKSTKLLPVQKPKVVSTPTVSISKSQLKPVSAQPLGAGRKPRIAFVLDDWGYRMGNCKYLKEIKAPLAIAVLPGIRYTNEIMKCASIYNKEIMLHLPLEPYYTADNYPDYYLITTSMPKAKVERILDDTFKKMPLIVGVNNHMGSKATENLPLMKTVFSKIKKKGLFFMDSMTAPKSVCTSLAAEMKLPFTKRDVFLDNENTKEAIELQLVELAHRANRQGYAIAIGHDRQLTMQVLKENIPILQKQGFEIVRVTELLSNK